MKRSSKRRKVVDVPTAEIPDANNKTPAKKRLDREEDLAQGIFGSQVFETPFDDDDCDGVDGSDEHLYEEDFGDEYDPDFTEDFMQMNPMDESSDTLLDDSDDAFIDEVIQSLTKSFALDLGNDIDRVANVHHLLERSMVEALDAANTTAFFEHVLNDIDQVVPLIDKRNIQTEPRRQHKRKASATNRKAEHNGHQHRRHKLEQHGRGQAAALEAPYQPLVCILRELRSMFRRYSLRGLDELDALEDTATLFAELNVDAALPILTGLTARVMIRPKLDQPGQELSPAFYERLLESTEQAVTTLLESGAVQALPGVAYNLGQLAIRKGLSAKALPKLLRQSALRTAASPKLIKLLSSSNLGAVTLTSARPSDRPLQLRVNGPLEIIIRTP
ncbi:hypothetical protein [Acaryochloris sp. CCMEE 5410]|uniref:hypothetical protein n=1 Tax=Acaryochloris sp. CCMEE 5410 TaxID=310037 RepID=UPI0002485265|nr:hypothetical protein [Acaryochloris sp. CCMEE 5410]KAI9135123.1 hypothetical protein ON05_019025 [Acaryochloris sp. CCMEE 5410]